MNRLRTLVFLFISALSISPCASLGAAEFSTAVQLLKEGKLQDARTAFIELEASNEGHPALLLNLGLVAQKEKKLGAAMALWKKGLAFHPSDDSLINAVDWIKPKLPKAEIARSLDAWEQWRNEVFLRVSPFAVVALSALFLLASGAYLLRWWAGCRRALHDETAMPPAPVAGAILGLLFVFLFAISIAIYVDRLDLRGTIITEKIDVRSAPELAATSLFEAFEGMEVIVRESRVVGSKEKPETWRRITYPGGGSGWIPASAVFTSADPSSEAFKSVGVSP